jgi:glycosyltransferase involved in cell wall biosynthesis
MRVILILDDLTSGGVQRQMVNMALEYKRHGDEVEVVTYHDRDFFSPVLLEAGVKYTCLNQSNALKRLLVFRRYLRKQQPDLVIAQALVANFISEFASAPRKSWKLMVIEGSADPRILTSKKSKYLRYFHVFADAVVANSSVNAEMVKTVVPFVSDKVHVVYNMVDMEEWKPDPNYRFKKDNTVRLVVAASHRYLKNAAGMLRALLLLTPEERARLHITWYGKALEPPYLDNSIVDARAFIEEHKITNVEFRSDTPNIREAVMQFDAAGLFSFYEGQPNAICEAMSLGKPIIASTVSDLPTLVKEDQYGKLFDPHNDAQIAEAYRWLLAKTGEEMAQMGQLSRAAAVEFFERERIFRDFNALSGLDKQY